MLVHKNKDKVKLNKDNTQRTIILDAGSWVKSGFSGDDQPQAYTPSIVANYPDGNNNNNNNNNYIDNHRSGPFVGNNALKESSKSPSLTFSFPIECGLPIVLDNTEILIEHILKNVLLSDVYDNNILMTKKSLYPKKFQSKIGESMFEKFKCNKFSYINTDLTSIMMTGRSTGVIVDMGSSQCMIVPIIDGTPQYHTINRLELGGRDITRFLEELIEKNSEGKHRFRSAAEIDVVRKIKEQACVIYPNWNNQIAIKEVYEKNEQCYELPDGQRISLGFERVEAPEILFKPGLIGMKDDSGLASKIVKSINECDIHMRRDLYSNIILIGGTSMISGLEERLYYELEKLIPSNVTVKIITHKTRNIIPWQSCSILSSLSTFNDISDDINNNHQYWITNEQYEEYGVNIFNRL